MPESFEGDLAGSEIRGADLSGATFRDIDLTGARISHAVVDDVEVDALVDRLVVNGVDVTAYVNERDPWYPLRTVLRAAAPAELREAWARLGEAWAATIARARALPDGAVHESVGGEWSFVETLRHLVFAMDKWFTAPVLGGGFDPLGLPNTGSVDFPWPGLDAAPPPDVEGDAAGVLVARSDRDGRLRDYLATATDDDLDRTVEVLENGPHTVRQCVRVVIEEEFWHHRYAVRDLDRLTRGAGR